VQAHHHAGADSTGIEDEDDPVLAWRFDQFSALGFDEIQAVLLANSDVDLHLTRSLIARGCPPTLAAKIAL
jgi:hypothetical protein